MRFPLHRDDLRNGLLDNAVQYRGNVQGAGLPIRLGDVHALDRPRPISARLKLCAYLPSMVSEVLRQFIDRHAVDARRAFVVAHSPQCTLQIGPVRHLGQQPLGVNRFGLA